MAQADHLIDEELLLLVVEACVKRLGSVGHVALVGGAIDLWPRYGLPAVVAAASTLFVLFGLWTGRDR